MKGKQLQFQFFHKLSEHAFFMQILEIPFLYQLQDLWSVWMFIQVCHSDLKNLEQWNKGCILMELITYILNGVLP